MDETQEKIISIILQHYPAIAKQDIKVFDDGWDHIVCVVSGKKAFRFPRNDEYRKKLTIEAEFLQQLTPLSPVDVPNLALHTDSKGYPYVTYPFIHGVPLTRELSQTFTPQQMLSIAEQIGNFLSVLHNFSVDQAFRMGVPQQGDLSMTLQQWFMGIENRLFSYIKYHEQQWITKLFTDELNIARATPVSYRIIHGDMAPEHIIVDPQSHTLCGIIDFGDIEIGDPAYDFTYLNWYGPEFLEKVYKVYRVDKDPAFDKRREFYEKQRPIKNLDHSITYQIQDKIELHQKQLSEYIISHPHG